MIHGFLRVASATNDLIVGDCGENTASILALIKQAYEKKAQLVVFPELCITGASCQDLFNQELLCRVALGAVRLIAEKTKDLAITSIVGFPFLHKNVRYNATAVIFEGRVLGIVPKYNNPRNDDLGLARYFANPSNPSSLQILPAGIFGPYEVPFGNLLFMDNVDDSISFAIDTGQCTHNEGASLSFHACAASLITADLLSKAEGAGSKEWRANNIKVKSKQQISAILYASAGPGESSTDLVFSGARLIAEYGEILNEGELYQTGLSISDIDVRRLLNERRRYTAQQEFSSITNFSQTKSTGSHESFCVRYAFVHGTDTKQNQQLLRFIDPHPFIPADAQDLQDRCTEVFNIQKAGLYKRLKHLNAKKIMIGLSGGLDSTLSLLVAVKVFDQLSLDRNGIMTISMPGFGTTNQTKTNAQKLAKILGVSFEEIKITKSVSQHFKDIGHDPQTKDVVFENAQARERTQILMDKGNMHNAIVVGTGDLSELALGWSTYNGDHMSMYGTNASIPKTLVRALVTWCAQNAKDFVFEDEGIAKKTKELLHAILDTPVSPELLPPSDGNISQKTEEIVGPYELHDFFLYHLVRWGSSPAKILFLAEQAFSDQENGPYYERDTILHWLKIFYKRFFAQQFKRSCMPDGPKTGSVNLSPRGSWLMPSDASCALWLKELETLE